MDQASRLEDLQEILQYRFQEPQLLVKALVHRSFVHENPARSRSDNEIFEFLGDAVLSLAISHTLIDLFPDYNEGDLSRIRSSIVNERELARVAMDMQLGEFLLLGKGEELSGGRQKVSLLADSLEALLGAVYLDGGLKAAIAVVKLVFRDYLNTRQLEHPLKSLDKDYKTQLQEFTQAHFRKTPIYLLESEEGPDHDKTFHVRVALGGRLLAHGSGKSKKEAQQDAARTALEEMLAGYDPAPETDGL